MNNEQSGFDYRLTEEGGKFERVVPGYHSLTKDELQLRLELQKQEAVIYMQGGDLTPHNNGNKYYLIADGNVIKYDIEERVYKILDKDIWKWVEKENLFQMLDFNNRKAMEWQDFKDLFEDEKKNLDKDFQKIEDGIYGLAIGDALGVPVEFLSRFSFKITDMMGYGTHNVPEGTWSDDTSLTIAAMDSIAKKNYVDYNDIMKNFSKWRNNAEYTATNKFFDIGIATSSAINMFESGVDPIKCGGTSERSNGNGSLMRILPFVYYSYYLDLDRENEVDLINNGSSITHAHEISRLGCLIYYDYLKNILNGIDKIQALDMLKDNDYDKYYKPETIKYYESIISGNIKNLSENDIKSSGFVVSSLEASIWSVITTNSLEDAVIKAVNLGDDTDTVGAITGSIAGIIYGKKAIPERWINKLQNKQYLDKIINDYSTTLENLQTNNLKIK